MTPLAQMTIGEAISSVRDITVVAGILIIGWKARSWIQPFIDFFEESKDFMKSMRRDMQTLLTNHLHHIEADLKTMSGRKGELDQ